MRSLSQLSAGTSGLTSAQAAESLLLHGPNRLTPLPKEPIWKKFIEKFDDSIIKILLAATLLKTVVDLAGGEGGELDVTAFGLGVLFLAIVLGGLALAKLGQWIPTAMFGCALVLVGASVVQGHPSYEGLAVMLAVVLATGVAFISEFRSDKEFEALNSHKDSIGVKVIRDGEVVQLPLEQVVVGDLISLEMGDEIPADGRITQATELAIDQSLLTGESEPQKKRPESTEGDGPDRPDCVYRGTQVVDGQAQMVVAEVGDSTMIGEIAKKLGGDEADDADGDNATPDTPEARIQKKLTISKELTPLQIKLEGLAGTISKIGYIAAILIFLALLVQGIITGEVGGSVSKSISAILSYFVYMVIVIVVAVPEGLPMSVTVSLALAMRKMTRANSLVRQLVACETIGSATVICSDKTGTLTQNRMSVERLAALDAIRERGKGHWPTPNPEGKTSADAVALNSAINSTAHLEEKEGRTVIIGNSTEGALLNWLREAGHDYRRLREHAPVLELVPFTSERKRMVTVARANNSAQVFMKGAPEVVLAFCSHYLTEEGERRELNDEGKLLFTVALKAAADDAMRTLGFASKPIDESALGSMSRDELEANLTFAGFVGIRDPLREDVPEAVRRCREAGIQVKMITGDNIDTAKAIGREIGLLDSPDALAITSQEFNAMTDDEVRAKADNITILARAKPLDKYRMVKLLQANNHVVAVTGDGTNDAPALKKADVGLAMGIAGTEVAKEASKIVLLDDSFATIVNAVNWGRALYENIQRFILFQLTINVSALTIAFLGPFFGVKPPFTVLQLLWINVIMDTFASIALCSEPPRAGLMRMAPKRKDESIVTPEMLRTILATAGFFVVVMLVILLGMQNYGWFGEEGADSSILSIRQVSMFFTIYVMFQVWNQINCRSLTPEKSGLAGLFRNRTFLMITGLIVLGQVAIVSVGGKVGQIFQTEPLTGLDWLGIMIGTASVLVFAEVVRLFRRGKTVA